MPIPKSTYFHVGYGYRIRSTAMHIVKYHLLVIVSRFRYCNFNESILTRHILQTGLCVFIVWFSLSYKNSFDESTHKNMNRLRHQQKQSQSINETHNDTLANLHNFEFVINNATLCMESASTENPSSVIVIMVHTARNNFNHRYAIRNTWGSVKKYRQWHLHLIFLLGIDSQNPSGSYEQNKLLDESKEHGDIIMGNFEDTYHNLTYKHLMGYKWVNKFCPTAKFILKTDDDIYADIYQIMDVILEELRDSNKTFACENMGGNKPVREIANKWYVSEETFPGDMYPDFCSGSAYLVKADDATKIYSVSNKTKFFWIDDVFVTGILRETFDVVVHNRNESSLQILSIYSRHHLGDKSEIINWCAKDLSINQLNYAFILLTKDEFVRDMFCIWNKVRLMRYAMNVVVDSEIH
ncbi:Beta-1,3-galactosyltransferase 5 [Pseudolycoriella hygida]|uniref:Hexosyltransferase n=1 Tax=Pseudolycoriella hygida TaxID=35572 RepID=A0A9Q0NA96_9DIPT|nr:Beta-1,3-galactosyltransferase 5 [Pseudolycoriella hygida]